MIVFLLVMGVILGAAAVNGTIPQLGQQANKDLFSQGNKAGFLKWMAAILVIAAIAKAIDLPEAGKALLVLIFIAFVLSGENGDLLTSIVNQISSLTGPTSSPDNNTGSPSFAQTLQDKTNAAAAAVDKAGNIQGLSGGGNPMADVLGPLQDPFSSPIPGIMGQK